MSKKYAKSTKQLATSRLKSETELVITREDTPQADAATYTFPYGLTLTATRHGVAIAGAGGNYTGPTLAAFKRVLKKAETIHDQLFKGRGLPSEAELDRERQLRVITGRKVTAYYIGHKDRISGDNVPKAVSALREHYRGAEAG